MNTKLYGMYKPLFMKSKEIVIRHVVTPSVSYTYTPDFGKSRYGYYETYTYTDEMVRSAWQSIHLTKGLLTAIRVKVFRRTLASR